MVIPPRHEYATWARHITKGANLQAPPSSYEYESGWDSYGNYTDSGGSYYDYGGSY